MDNITVEDLMLKLKSDIVSENEDALIDALENLTSLMRSTHYRNDLEREHWDVIDELSEKASQILLKEKKSDKELDFLTSLLRFLRNSCGGSLENLDYFLRTPSVLNFGKETLKHFSNAKSLKEKLIIKIAVQLFGNILFSNENLLNFVWDIFHERQVFRKLFIQEDNSIKECAMKVFCHCLNENTSKFICTNTKDEGGYLNILIDLYIENEIQSILDVMKRIFEEDVLFNSYNQLDSFRRCVLLEMVVDSLKEDKNFLVNSIKKLMNIFEKEISDTLHSFLTPYEVMRILFILCKASLKENYGPILQNNQELLKACIGCLKVIHLLRSQKNSPFSTDLDSSYSGFKSQLVRLIGNLSYKCKENQNIVRSLDGIPLILDCCKLDEDNPYIREWCILAIRNLLENNHENQAIIAGISSTGEVVQSEFLSSIGLEAKNEEGHIRVRPVPRSSNCETDDENS